MDLVNAQILGHQLGHSGGITGQHDGAHALRLKALAMAALAVGFSSSADQDRAQESCRHSAT